MAWTIKFSETGLEPVTSGDEPSDLPTDLFDKQEFGLSDQPLFNGDPFLVFHIHVGLT